MFDTIWKLISDPANQSTLGWIGGGVVVVATGLWKVLKKDKPTVSADHGGVAVGGNMSGSTVQTNKE